jgi:hypothetical protein
MLKKQEYLQSIESYNALISKIADFAYDYTENSEIEGFLDEFFGVSEEDQEEFFWEWLWYDLPFLENKTLIETYILQHEERLSQNQLEYLIGLQKSYRSCFKIISRSINFGIRIKDVFTSQMFFVNEIKGSVIFRPGDVLYARLIPTRRGNFFSGACAILKDSYKNFIKQQFDIQKAIISPKMQNKAFLKRHGGVAYQILFD